MSAAYWKSRHPAMLNGWAKHRWIEENLALLRRELEVDGLFPVAWRYNCEVKTLAELAHRHGWAMVLGERPGFLHEWDARR